jgi:hypothetical protein
MVDQGTMEWRQERLGRITASMCKHTIAKTKTGWSSSRKDYMMQLLAERLSGTPEDFYVTKSMQWGMDQERYGRLRYQDLQGYDVEEVGFIQHPWLKNCGASPDGVVSSRYLPSVGLVEIKCPNTSTHVENMARDGHDQQYEAQMTLQMLCTKASWCDMVSYDPRLPAPLDICINRYYLDLVFAKELQDGIKVFEEELNDNVLKFVAKFPDVELQYRKEWMNYAD